MTNKKYDVVALGELLIDFTENGLSAQGNPLLEANPGGAPCNVLSMLQKLGDKTAFIGKVGNDGFGHLLTKAVQEQGIDTTGLVYDNDVHTTLALVLKKENGDRDFAFYRNPGADMNLKEEEVDESLIASSSIFHFGTLSLTDESVKKATQQAVKVAKENGLTITFDPNLREPLWRSLEEAHKQVAWGLQQADVVKISDNEIQFVSGKEDYDEGIAYLQETYNIPLILLTMGKDGSRAYYKGMRVERPGFSVKAIETTGAGDTFCGSSLNYLVDHDFENLTEEQLGEMLTFANAAAALVTTKKGAIKAMPVKEEVLELIQK